MTELTRTTFATPRAAEFLEQRALQAQTGQPSARFGDVVIKELMDNALDAAETAGRAPEIEVAVAVADDRQEITVADNGNGIPPEVVTRILDFNVLVSDKSAYRSPTRGMQGNAWKTLLGIPYALGVLAPVIIEACGVRHAVAVALDPGGNVVVRHDRDASARTTGTSVTVPLPLDLEARARGWVQKFAAVNPHATLSHLEDRTDPASAEICKATAQDGWRKPVPTDATSPYWYDETALKRLVFAHIGAARQGARDLPVGEFIRTFAGLSSKAKAKSVKAAVPGIERLSDFEGDPEAVAVLLKAMRAEAKIPNPAVLGQVPEDHYRQWMAAFGTERFWFRRRRLEVDGVPWLLEVAVAQTAEPGAVVYGVNYSATFADPFSATRLWTDEVSATGAASFLAQSDASPEVYGDHDDRRAVVVHAVCPALEFTDKGKVALTVPAQVAEAFAETLAEVTKPLYRERKRAERDARKARQRAAREIEQERRREEREERGEREPKITLKEAVFEVMEAAVADASGEGSYPFPTRNLLYAVRPLIQRLTDAELKMNYFSQTLVVEWERAHGRIHGHYRDPRGELVEPHTRNTVRLGTREVADYQLPAHLYDKILYVEKQGLNPIFEAAQLAERYDMAIASGKGEPVEAVRALFERAGRGDYKLFVLHDADHSGYTIARAMAEETARMPGYSVDVIDLGLSVGDAIAAGLETERYTRRIELPWWMPERLTEQEMEWFGGREIARKQWDCTRVELNALKAGIIAYIEAGLARHGAAGKVIPPESVIKQDARETLHTQVRELVDQVIAETLDPEALFRAALATVPADVTADIQRDDVAERLEQRRHLRWRNIVNGIVGGRLYEHDDTLRARVRELLAEQGAGS